MYKFKIVYKDSYSKLFRTEKFINSTILYYSMIVRKVFKAKKNNQKLITIPKDCDIVEGDYVKIEKVKNE